LNYYNEIDPFAAEWLRNLIKAGHIAPGDVDTRSIVDVSPDDLRGYVQCHFFAGVGVWSYALRRAGWPDDRPVWTGSCPCQPFSTAGKGKGFEDERHLWPNFYNLIRQCQPPVVFGEQVASKDGLAWLDLVQADLEASKYAFGAADLCAAGVGAPHIRQRLYWVADAVLVGQQGSREVGRPSNQAEDGYRQVHRVVDASSCGGLADSCFSQRETDGISSRVDPEYDPTRDSGSLDRMADASSDGHLERDTRSVAGRQAGRLLEPAGMGDAGGSRPTNGHWRDADWLYCRDGKWRPVESGTFPLAHGAASRVGRLRAYGNAIVPQVAETFIRAYTDSFYRH
jgi:DNA (cytosine-5)-methyltransferase 1